MDWKVWALLGFLFICSVACVIIILNAEETDREEW